MSIFRNFKSVSNLQETRNNLRSASVFKVRIFLHILPNCCLITGSHIFQSCKHKLEVRRSKMYDCLSFLKHCHTTALKTVVLYCTKAWKFKLIKITFKKTTHSHHLTLPAKHSSHNLFLKSALKLCYLFMLQLIADVYPPNMSQIGNRLNYGFQIY